MIQLTSSQPATQHTHSRSRTDAPLLDALENRLKAYALAAGAGGVGLLALAQLAPAEVIFTPTQIMLQNGTIFIDINGDGVNDFALVTHSRGVFHRTHVDFQREREIEMYSVEVIARQGEAAALQRGETIGSQRNFRHAHPPGQLMVRASGTFGSSFSFTSNVTGEWNDVGYRFLGLKFLINGEAHYGWARVEVHHDFFMRGELSGYAYETIPGQPILAGQKSGTIADPEFISGTADGGDAQNVDPATGSLGVLARGSPGTSRGRTSSSP